jgi:lipoate-protein ligase B
MTFNKLIEKYEISQEELSQNGKNFVITKLNWPYEKSLNFQNEANKFVYENPDYCIYIITSHPSVLTMGRGLQRGMVDKHNLIEFDENLSSQIPVEVYNVKRGGGLTFHHPGQIVLYPIVHIGHQKIKTIQLMNKVFAIAKDVIEKNTELRGLEYERDLLGLWSESHKIASMGIQLIKFVSLHGLAINILRDDTISDVLKKVYPCGLSGMVYKSVEELSSVDHALLVKDFKKSFESIVLN